MFKGFGLMTSTVLSQSAVMEWIVRKVMHCGLVMIITLDSGRY